MLFYYFFLILYRKQIELSYVLHVRGKSTDLELPVQGDHIFVQKTNKQTKNIRQKWLIKHPPKSATAGNEREADNWKLCQNICLGK